MTTRRARREVECRGRRPGRVTQATADDGHRDAFPERSASLAATERVGTVECGVIAQ